MKEKGQYYVLKEKAVPEVLLKVVEAKRLIESGKIASVQEKKLASAGVLFINIKMIFFHFMTRQREGQLRLSSSWMMNRGCYPLY